MISDPDSVSFPGWVCPREITHKIFSSTYYKYIRLLGRWSSYESLKQTVWTTCHFMESWHFHILYSSIALYEFSVGFLGTFWCCGLALWDLILYTSTSWLGDLTGCQSSSGHGKRNISYLKRYVAKDKIVIKYSTKRIFFLPTHFNSFTSKLMDEWMLEWSFHLPSKIHHFK